MKGFVVWILSLIVLAYAGVCVMLWSKQGSLIYYPTAAVANPLADELRLDSGGESLQLWRLAAGNEHAVIYFGGNAEDVSLNSSDMLRYLGGATVYLVNYRGYGGSSGTPSEVSLFRDALSVYDYVAGHHPEISIVGRSLGSGVATYLATSRETSRLVLVTPYDSLVNVAQAAYPIVPVSLLLRDRYDSVGRADAIRVPTLVAIAEFDEVIARAHTDRLVAALEPSITSVEIIGGATHNTIGDRPQYMRLMSRFLLGRDNIR